MWKETVMAYVKEYPGNWLARLRETTKIPQSGQLVSGYKFEPGSPK